MEIGPKMTIDHITDEVVPERPDAPSFLANGRKLLRTALTLLRAPTAAPDNKWYRQTISDILEALMTQSEGWYDEDDDASAIDGACDRLDKLPSFKNNRAICEHVSAAADKEPAQ